MPKSKRNKTGNPSFLLYIWITLSKTKKKGRGQKENIVNSIRDAVESYNSVYVFNFENMRNLKFKEFRDQLRSNSRFFLGSNKVMQVSLGRSVADEIRPGLHKVSKLLRGNSGLCFTNMPKDEAQRFLSGLLEIKGYHCPVMTTLESGLIKLYFHSFGRIFNEYEEYDFARTGSSATETVELKEGPLEQFTHEMEPFLRKQGMPVRLNKGMVSLSLSLHTHIHTISIYVYVYISISISLPHTTDCFNFGQVWWSLFRTSLFVKLGNQYHQSHLAYWFVKASQYFILAMFRGKRNTPIVCRLLGNKMATFRLHLICRWSPDEFEIYQEGLMDSDIESS
ncbi:hypothetical protein RJ639_022434 [Escallonia herrerae]|uniref:Ribosome assembly factor mrt4 n=1 Tax=Escallonia herrerae TaxID=1293975 RepID=A0AA88V5H1_9ASTE|nr:hypothetical protein RJ639_022434 [Escallonia herrerae]